MRVIDLTHKITDKMPVYPGDIPTELARISAYAEDGYSNFMLTTGMHAGTHIDGIMHMSNINKPISEYSVNSFIGQGCIIDARNLETITYREEYEKSIFEQSIVLILTGQDKLYGQSAYYDSHPVLDDSFCDLLVRKNIKMVGVDMPSIDRYPFNAHKKILGAGILIAENLTNLSCLLGLAGFEVVALPLNIECDSSIARVVAVVR